MLLGREHETAQIDRLLDEARKGKSGVLVLSGEPGIGKTALLDYAAGRAEGMIVLAARGIESEAELPFVALADLLRPVLRWIDAVPDAQAAALRAALALGPPRRGDRFTVCAGVLSLCAVAADESPVLVLIDDAQFVDRSSMQAVFFAARRLDAEGIALLVAHRSGTDLGTSGLPQLGLQGLPREAATALLTRSGPVAAAVAAELIAGSGANPLALIELPSLLSPGQLSGADPIAGPIPAGDALERAFLRRVEELPDQTQQALVVAAASGSYDFDEILAAVERAGLEPDALDAAERANLTLVTGSRFAFVHPLLRSAVYHGAPAGVRRAAHRALAGGGGERRPWHLAAASEAPDAGIAAELKEGATSASGRGAMPKRHWHSRPRPASQRARTPARSFFVAPPTKHGARDRPPRRSSSPKRPSPRPSSPSCGGGSSTSPGSSRCGAGPRSQHTNAFAGRPNRPRPLILCARRGCSRTPPGPASWGVR